MGVGLCLQRSARRLGGALGGGLARRLGRAEAAVPAGTASWCARRSLRCGRGASLGQDLRALPSGAGSAAAAPSDGSDLAPERVSVYFLATREWCDHLLLRADGAFEHGSCPSSRGSWSLSEEGATAGGGAAGPALTLRWAAGDLGTGELKLVSSGADLEAFEGAGAARLRRVGGAALPSPRAAARPAARSALPPAELQPAERRRALVFSSVGTQCLPVVRDHWLRDAAAVDFDVALVFYGEPSEEVFQQLQQISDTHDAVEVFQHRGMKWPNFRHWLDLQGGAAAVAARYDYIWVVDDDVRLPTSQISRMFDILREHTEVDFACPSFDAGSDGVWRFFDRHDPRFKLRYTNFVECTAPVLKSSMLLNALFEPVLRAVRTGCFIDFCFFHAAGGREDGVAVLDAVQCHHPPRTRDAPSEMEQAQAWSTHKSDDVYFRREGVPSEWWDVEPRFFQPRVFGALPAVPAPAAAPPGAAGGPGAARGRLVLPAVGFGTSFYPEDHELGPEEAVVSAAVDAALRSGVRLFDCANQYSSQPFVGAALERAVAQGVVAREDLVVVAKIARFGTEAEVRAGVQTALAELRLDSVDVLMPHIPPPVDSWRWFEDEVDAGRARFLGVSNFDQLDVGEPGSGVRALRELLRAARIRPAVHEFELHPLLHDEAMVELCRTEGIRILAYSPLGAPHKVDKYLAGVGRLQGAAEAARRKRELSVLQHPGVEAVARYRGATPALTTLRWHVQHGFVPIPKSWNAEHIAANGPAAVCAEQLGATEMSVLDGMHSDVRTVVLYKKGAAGEL